MVCERSYRVRYGKLPGRSGAHLIQVNITFLRCLKRFCASLFCSCFRSRAVRLELAVGGGACKFMFLLLHEITLSAGSCGGTEISKSRLRSSSVKKSQLDKSGLVSGSSGARLVGRGKPNIAAKRMAD